MMEHWPMLLWLASQFVLMSFHVATMVAERRERHAEDPTKSELPIARVVRR